MLTDYCFYTTQGFQAERTEDQQTPAGRSHWLEPKEREDHGGYTQTAAGYQDSWMISGLTCSRWRTLRSVWAELRLRHWVHPRSRSRRDKGWNSNVIKSLSWENSSCLIRSSAVTYRKKTLRLHYSVSSHVVPTENWTPGYRSSSRKWSTSVDTHDLNLLHSPRPAPGSAFRY